ncbi:MAG: branched-chain amino acid ABC transporter permease [Reyranella sp.]|nr:MAG: branched-chain amino acid ABC transporter permease [Reyranella sp.]
MLLLILGPWYFSPRMLAIMNTSMIMAVAVLGLQINLGYAGQVNLGQAAFMGVGAYASGVLANFSGLGFILVIPLAGLASAVFGYLFGVVAARIKGFYLALTTLAAQFVFHFVVINLPSEWAGGAKGLALAPASLFGFQFNSESSLYLLNLAVLVLMTYGGFSIVRGRHGRNLVAVRDEDTAAGIMGVDVVGTKVNAFLIGSFFAGVAGALWAYYLRYISVDQFTLFNSIWMIGMIIVGGMGSITGALIGVVVVRAIQEGITSVAPIVAEAVPSLGGELIFASYNMVLGILIAASLLIEPKGLMHRWNTIKSSYRIWPYPF